VASAAAAEHLLVKDGKYWRTHLGTIVVFGGGYSGALPGAAAAIDGTDAIYATGQVTTWQAETIEIPPIRQILDRTANQWYALAEREYAVGYDCVVAAAPYVYGSVSP
jgi:hypothetical protein